MQPQRETAQVCSNQGDDYSKAKKFPEAIRAYRRALELNPEPELAMLICWNLALAIWFRDKFLERDDTNTTDAQWESIMAARALYRYILSLYETHFKGQAESRGFAVGKLYQFAKDNLVDTRKYSMARLPDGRLFPRVEPQSFRLEEWLRKQ